MALAQLLSDDGFGGRTGSAEQPAETGIGPPYNLRPKTPHHLARATSVIQLFMNGGPSQMDLFDPKPELDRMDGRPYPGSVEEIGNQGANDVGVMMGGQYK
ncbi:MAG: DUF1501 domain-containing protein, partial [Planctomycetales bacterium]|nr:DUF1501 domain-containing protein [Planctomycetales bacterium]